MTVVGVDACKAGWVAVCLASGEPPRGVFIATLDELPAAVPGARGFAVDIPIGVPAQQPRLADLEAKKFVAARRNSVFLTPVRAALTAATHAEASAVARRLTGKGVSQQAYALGPRILEAEAWRRRAPAPVWEVHPEVSFTVLLGHPPQWPKKAWAGMVERLTGLRSAGIDLDDLGPAGGRAATDDVLDAAVAAWSAARLVSGKGRSFPDPPERDPATGEAVAIWT